jgi:hypothetical protein
MILALAGVFRDKADTKPEHDHAASAADNSVQAREVRNGVLKVPVNARRAGSFTVFAIPAAKYDRETTSEQTPSPGEDYFIVLQLKLPPGLATYSLSDLDGSVTGTDKYQQGITENAYQRDSNGKLSPLRPHAKIYPADGSVQFLVRVPGGATDVRDTIKVKSGILNEERELVLSFSSSPHSPISQSLYRLPMRKAPESSEPSTDLRTPKVSPIAPAVHGDAPRVRFNQLPKVLSGTLIDRCLRIKFDLAELERENSDPTQWKHRAVLRQRLVENLQEEIDAFSNANPHMKEVIVELGKEAVNYANNASISNLESFVTDRK